VRIQGIKRQIIERLWEGPKTFKQLLRIKGRKSTIKAQLTRLIKEGRIKQEGDTFKLLYPKRRLYATIWYHPMGKYKLDETIVVENGKTVSWGVGGSFYWHKGREKESVLKEALLDFMFWDPELDEKENERMLKQLKKEVEVIFVSDEEMKRLKRKYPEEKPEVEEADLSYIG